MIKQIITKKNKYASIKLNKDIENTLSEVKENIDNKNWDELNKLILDLISDFSLEKDWINNLVLMLNSFLTRIDHSVVFNNTPNVSLEEFSKQNFGNQLLYLFDSWMSCFYACVFFYNILKEIWLTPKIIWWNHSFVIFQFEETVYMIDLFEKEFKNIVIKRLKKWEKIMTLWKKIQVNDIDDLILLENGKETKISDTSIDKLISDFDNLKHANLKYMDEESTFVFQRKWMFVSLDFLNWKIFFDYKLLHDYFWDLSFDEFSIEWFYKNVICKKIEDEILLNGLKKYLEKCDKKKLYNFFIKYTE